MGYLWKYDSYYSNLLHIIFFTSAIEAEKW
jgi:hypothetical protein